LFSSHKLIKFQFCESPIIQVYRFLDEQAQREDQYVFHTAFAVVGQVFANFGQKGREHTLIGFGRPLRYVFYAPFLKMSSSVEPNLSKPCQSAGFLFSYALIYTAD
jgi:hypothetical protein